MGRIVAAVLVLAVVAVLCTQSALYGNGSFYHRYQTDGVNYIPDLPGGAQYVSMGDSYAAAGSHSKRLPLDLCARNADDLGHVIAQRMQPQSFTDRACSGATLDDLTQQTVQNDRAPQMYGIGPFTRLITLVAGANSLGFGGLITNCFVIPNDRCSVSAGMNLPGSDGWRFVKAQYLATIDVLHKYAPSAIIMLVGYLPLFALDGPVDTGCLGTAHIPMRNVELWRTWYRGLEQLVKEVAAERKLLYIAPPTGHPACTDDPYVALQGVDLRGHGPDAYGLHPTVAGQRAMGNLVEDRLRGRSRTPSA
ncbi:SGNH/GDSL hydrolase family protein [Tsukamurella sp. 8F]|uniref:SGNH/GDSL hydrolase family protein n=1 Tax=unclassified Tsukamurella TaxID=2633480 RepID=UPI0023B92C6B|nr:MULTISPECIES: SGNH/GDSL hydrolase family protein [unclassified Tsukamurella]MDF0531569.1 SGNH/GDSL hydrolase family protein [Tsukamurella sp. 8J]MDF0587584.1 SGNH/GDSL hydrolase family protein [Tsukamurella sp. 8F]